MQQQRFSPSLNSLLLDVQCFGKFYWSVPGTPYLYLLHWSVPGTPYLKNTLHSITDSTGTIWHDTDKIHSIFTTHFKHIFTSTWHHACL